ncbi:MAG: FAD-binding domain-containing protein, partial [Flavobacteriales bacterium]
WPQKPKRGFKSYSEWKRELPPGFGIETTSMNTEGISLIKPNGFKGGRMEGLRHMNHYFFTSDGLSRYDATRNGLLGESYSSRLSPWLALGCLGIREVWSHVIKFESQRGPTSSTETFKKELLWRAYFRWVMDTHGVRMFHRDGIRSKPTTWRHSEPEFKAWCEGKTESAFVNAMMNELNTTGFIGNRARQIAASYLINELRIDWRWGAAYFEAQLIDYDVSSNYGNWAYIAGVGTDPRGGRHFNIQYQEEQHDPDGAYQAFWNKKTISA